MGGQNPARCHLLKRFAIRYTEFLDLSALAPPICPTDAEDSIDEDQGWGCGYYSKKFAPISSLALVLCNRLIAAKVSNVRRSNNKKTTLRYKLDLMIWDCDLQLSLPVPSNT